MLAWLAAAAVAAQGPGFNCAAARLPVEQIVCGDARLAKLDRDLTDRFSALAGQGGVDPKALRADEDAWLAQIRNRCSNAACLARVYKARIDVLTDRSLKRASPVAYAETQPFPAPAATWAAARRAVGKPCGWRAGELGAHIDGFTPIRGALPVILDNGSVVARQREGARFAFFVRIDAAKPAASCTVSDVVALPSAAVAPAFLHCTAIMNPDGPANADNWIVGFGVRRPGQPQPVGFWTVRPDGAGLERIATGVIGLRGGLRCQEPETGD